MAIKGKGKPKSKQPARAPRRAPVPVKPPFAQRTWVKVTAAFIAGVFVLSMCWWVWENLDKDRNAKAAAATATQQQAAVAAWKAGLDAGLANVAQLQGGATPQIATSLQPAIDAVVKGTEPPVSADDLTALSDQLEGAAKKLDRFALSDAIADHGFSVSQSDEITAAHSELIAGLKALAVAADLTALAIQSPGDQQALTDAAQRAADTGTSLIQTGWNRYTNVSAEVGAPLSIPQGITPAGG